MKGIYFWLLFSRTFSPSVCCPLGSEKDNFFGFVFFCGAKKVQTSSVKRARERKNREREGEGEGEGEGAGGKTKT